MKIIGSNYAANGSYLSTVSTHVKVDVKLATADTSGKVIDDEVKFEPRDAKIESNADMDHVNGGTGILTAQQNTALIRCSRVLWRWRL